MQAAAHNSKMLAHLTNSEGVQRVRLERLQCALHPPSQLQQCMSHLPFLQHKGPFLLQQFAAILTTSPTEITNPRKIRSFMAVIAQTWCLK